MTDYNGYIFASDSKEYYKSGKIIKVFIDKEDFYSLKNMGWYISNKGYVYTMINNHTIFIHRLIMGCCDSKMVIDHNDTNKLNNHKSNLTITTNENNLQKAWYVQNIYNTNKKVAMFDLKDVEYTKPIQVFDSQVEAAYYFNSNNQGSISNACRGRAKTAFGFRWKEVE